MQCSGVQCIKRARRASVPCVLAKCARIRFPLCTHAAVLLRTLCRSQAKPRHHHHLCWGAIKAISLFVSFKRHSNTCYIISHRLRVFLLYVVHDGERCPLRKVVVLYLLCELCILERSIDRCIVFFSFYSFLQRTKGVSIIIKTASADLCIVGHTLASLNSLLHFGGGGGGERLMNDTRY